MPLKQYKIDAVRSQEHRDWSKQVLEQETISDYDYMFQSAPSIMWRLYSADNMDRLKFTNPRDFIPQKIENVLEASYSPPFYRNQLLAESFHMIDTATLGIRRAYNIQKAKYFPMPDYNVSSEIQVEVIIYG